MPFMWDIQKREIYRDRKEINDCLSLGMEMESNYKWYKVSFWGD